jgi:hypothetical protein
MLELEKPTPPNEADLRAVPAVWYIHRLTGRPAWVQGVVLPRRLAPATITRDGNVVEIRYLNPDGETRYAEPIGNEIVKTLDLSQPRTFSLVPKLFVEPGVIAEADVPVILELSRQVAEPYPQCIAAAEQRLRDAEDARKRENDQKTQEARRAYNELARKVRRERIVQLALLVLAIAGVFVLMSFLTAVDPNLPSPAP